MSRAQLLRFARTFSFSTRTFVMVCPQRCLHSGAPSFCVVVQNLEKTITTRVLHDTFADFGEILSCKVATDKDGNSKGYGFVHFADPDAAKKAIEDVNGAQLGDSDKVVTVTEFISKQDRGDGKQNFTNVYVKNLPSTIQSEDDVRGLFKEFGTISSAACMKVRF
jgi:polyadenylate-binding protein